MIRIDVLVQNSFGHWYGFMDTQPNLTKEDAEAAVEELTLQANRFERLVIRQKDGTQVVFNKQILETAVISFLVSEVEDGAGMGTLSK